MSTRQQLIDTTAQLLEAQGYHGTGLNQIVKESGCPRGSLYYHFPEGKEELAAVAIAQRGRMMGVFLAATLAEHDDPIAAVDAVFAALGAHALGADYCGGAPLAAVALETAGASERLRAACQAAYAALRRPVEAKLIAGGYAPTLAAELATAITAAMEGAIVLLRAEHSVEPLEQTRAALLRLLRCTAEEGRAPGDA